MGDPGVGAAQDLAWTGETWVWVASHADGGRTGRVRRDGTWLTSMVIYLTNYILFFIFVISFLGVNVWRYTPPRGSVEYFLPRQSLLFDMTPHSVRPSSLRPSSSLVLHFHRPPSYIVLLSSHHMPIPRQPSFLDIRWDFPHFSCPFYSFILLFLILSSFVTLQSLRSIHIFVTNYILF